MPEQKRDRAVGPEIAAVLGERVAHVGNRSNAIIGQAIDDHRGAVDAVAFIAHFIIVDAFELAGAALSGAIDGILRHVVGRSLVYRESQPRVGRDITATKLGRDRDLPDEASEDLAALGVGRGFLVLDIRPLAVAGHDENRSMKMSGIIRGAASSEPGSAVSSEPGPVREANGVRAPANRRPPAARK